MMHPHTLLFRFSPPPPSNSLHNHRSAPLLRSPLLSSRLPPLLSATSLGTTAKLQEDGGPIELPPSPSTSSSIFAISDDPTPLQVSTSVLLTGAISVFLFRSLRRRAKRAKELRVRSSGVKDSKDIKQEALEHLKAVSNASLDPKAPPSPAQAFLGGLAAGAVAIILYKFSITIEAALNRQAISDNFSVRQLTITIRTIVNGLCYLATFVFGINSIGLLLYSVQLALGSFIEPKPSNSSPEQEDDSNLNTSLMTGGRDSENVAEKKRSDTQRNKEET